jgi:acyl-CoA thioester hydrolase
MSRDGRDERRENYREFIEIPTRWMDNDVYGHVNNVVYYSYFDTAVNGFLMRAAGLDYNSSDAVGVVAKTGCSFHGEISFPDILDIGFRVSRLGTSSVTYEIGIFRQGSEAPAATGHFVHVYVRHGEMTPVPIPDKARAALEKLVVEA